MSDNQKHDWVAVQVLEQSSRNIKKYVNEKHFVPLNLLNKNFDDNTEDPLEEVSFE